MNKRNLVAKIRREFPELKWKTAKHNIEGWDHYVLILDDKYVFRFPRTKEYLDILKHEEELLAYLKGKLNISIPEYQFVASDKSFAGYRMIQGTSLTKNQLEKFSDKTKHRIAKQLGEFLTQLHRVSTSIVKKYGVKVTDPAKEYQILEKDMHRLVYPKVAKKDKLLIENFLTEFKDYLKFPHKALVHNDLYYSHLLLASDKKSLAGIIDFADITIDDPAIDFYEFWLYGRDFITDVYDHYKGPKDKNFIKRTMMYYKRMPLYVMNATPESDGRTALTKGYKLFKEIYYDKKAFS